MREKINYDQLKKIRKEYVGSVIRIIEMKGYPEYTNKIGIIERIDSYGQMYGTWGGLAIILGEDKIEIVKKLGE